MCVILHVLHAPIEKKGKNEKIAGDEHVGEKYCAGLSTATAIFQFLTGMDFKL